MASTSNDSQIPSQVEKQQAQGLSASQGSRKLVPVLVLTVLAVFGIVAVAILFNRHVNGELFMRYQKEQRATAVHQAHFIKYALQSIAENLRELNLRIDDADGTQQNIEKQLATFLDHRQTDIHSVGFMDTSGILRIRITEEGPRERADISFESYAKRALSSQKTVVSGITVTADGTNAIIVHVPLWVDGQYRGTTYAAVSTTNIERWLRDAGRTKHDFSIILDHNNKVTVHPDRQFVHESVFNPPVPTIDDDPLTASQIRDGKIGLIDGHLFKSKRHIAAFSKFNVEKTEFTLIKCAPYAEIAASSLRFSRYTSILTGLAFLVTALGFVYAVYLFREDKAEWIQESASLQKDIQQHEHSEEEYQRLISQLEVNNAELERFAYTVSHDLKSPLITIKGFLGMLEKDIETQNQERIKSDVKRISNAAEKMQRLLDELLELSRVGRMESNREQFNLKELTDEVLELVSGRLQNSNIAVDVSQDLPTIFGDRARFSEVMQNLIENAVKFIGETEEPKIEIGVREQQDGQVVYLSDNGIGVDPDYAERIFQLFEQLDPNMEGTGMGLAMVKRILENEGSRIWVESEGHGTGTTFCFTVPYPESQEIDNDQETEDNEILGV